MSEPTHYLDIRIGIDYKELLSPDRIEGAKVALGVQDNGLIIESHANLLLDKVESAIIGRVEVSGIQAQVVENTEELEDSPTEDMDTNVLEEVVDKSLDDTMVESIVKLETLDLEKMESENVETETETEIETNDSFLILEMLDGINNHIFEIQSMLGTVNKVQIRSDKFTAAEIALNLGFDEAKIVTGAKELEVPYTIEFTNAIKENDKIMGEE